MQLPEHWLQELHSVARQLTNNLFVFPLGRVVCLVVGLVFGLVVGFVVCLTVCLVIGNLVSDLVVSFVVDCDGGAVLGVGGIVVGVN